MLEIRQGTITRIRLGTFLDDTDGNTEEDGLTIANTDILIWKAGAATQVAKNSGGATFMSNGAYYADLDATDTDTAGILEVFVHVAGALVVERKFMVLPAASFDAKYVDGLNNFDPATDQVIVGTNNDKDDYTIAGTKATLDALNDIAATAIVSNGAITTSGGAVSQVDTCVSNDDMRGTDNALLASNAPTNFSDLAITATTGLVSVGTNNDKTGYSISGTITTLDGLNNFDPTADTVSASLIEILGTAITETSAGRIANNFDFFYDNGDAQTTKTVDDVGTGGGGGGGDLVSILGTPITESSAGRIANNFDFFYDNGNAQTTKVVDDVGAGGGGGSTDWTATERNQIRNRLGIDGTAVSPAATPTLATQASVDGLNDFNPATDQVIVATNNDKDDYTIAGSKSTLDALNDITPAQVNSEVLDVLTVDTFNEPSSVPAANSSLKDKIGWIFTVMRNKITQTSTVQSIRNDGDTADIGTRSVSDDGTTTTQGKAN